MADEMSDAPGAFSDLEAERQIADVSASHAKGAPAKFIYLLNAMENAAQSKAPALNGYAGKRIAVLRYVSDLEQELAAAVESVRVLREALTNLRAACDTHERNSNGRQVGVRVPERNLLDAADAALFAIIDALAATAPTRRWLEPGALVPLARVREIFTRRLNLTNDQRGYSWHEIQDALEEIESLQK